MSSRVSNQSRIPVRADKEISKPVVSSKPVPKSRHLSNVDANVRLGSRSSVAEDEEKKTKTRIKSTAAEGKKTVGRKTSERVNGKTKILQDIEPIHYKENKRKDKENENPSLAGLVKVVINETCNLGPQEDHKAPKVGLEAHQVLKKGDLPEGVVNIDIEEGLYEYAADVILYLRGREKLLLLPVNFLDGGHTQDHMRAMLVDWLIQVQHHLNLCQETLYLCIIMLDNVLARRDILNDKLQLVGVTCMLLASKLEEYYPADISKLVHLTSQSYTNSQVIRMELNLLDVLGCMLYYPDIMAFLRRFTHAALRGEDKEFIKSCQYLVDSAIVDISFSTNPPSQQAAAGVLAANLLFYLSVNLQDTVDETAVWTPTLVHYTQYNLADLLKPAATMYRCLMDPRYTGANAKYKSVSKHQRIAWAAQFFDENLNRGLKWLDEMMGNMDPTLPLETELELEEF